MEELIESAESAFLAGNRPLALEFSKKYLAEGGDPDRALMLVGLCELSRSPGAAATAFSMVGEKAQFKCVALLNEAISLSLKGDPSATDKFSAALASAPPHPKEFKVGKIKHSVSRCKIHFALAQHLQKMLDHGRASEHLERCLGLPDEMSISGIDPDHARLDLAYARMREGLFDERSWLLHESRWFRVPRRADSPANFSDPKDKTVLVHMEQGMGDNIQFVRFARGLKEMGARTILKSRKPLLRLTERIDFIDTVLDEDLPDPPHDLHLHTMSLPHLLGIGPDTGRYSEPYLSPDPLLSAEWARRLPPGPKVGMVWRGNPRKGEDPEIQRAMARRNIDPRRLAEIAPEGFEKISLQKDGEHMPGIHDPMPGAQDYHDTAAIIDNLDVVVGVDTSVIHLAAAMGKPTIMLSRRDACWRWGKGEKTPWYPSMTVLRQEQAENWEAPLRRARNILCGAPRDPQTREYFSQKQKNRLHI